MKHDYPVILTESNQVEVALSREQLGHLNSVDDLILAIKSLAVQAVSG
jgi:hypothetical protein